MNWRVTRLAVLWTVGGATIAGGGYGAAASGSGERIDPEAVEAQASDLGPVERSRLREAGIAVLLELAASEDAQVRANAIEGLIPVPVRLEAVLPAALADENEGVRTVAGMAVGECELRGLISAVRPRLDDPSPYVRAAAIYALRACGEEVDPTPLGQMVTRDPSAKVRSHAAYLLGELADKGTSALLRDAAMQQVPRASAVENKVLQVQIAEALVKLGDTEQLHTIRAALYPSTPEELDATVLAVQVLGEQRDRPSAGQLHNLAVMRDPGGNPMPIEVRLAVAGALGALGNAEFEPVAMASIESGSDPERIQAAWALGEMATSAAVRALEGKLADPAPRVRVAAAAALLRAVEKP
jgi:HEAT repeat protein